MLVSLSKPMMRKVGEISRFVSTGHHSFLAHLGEGGRVKERCDVKCYLLMSLFLLKISKYYKTHF